MAGNSFGKVFVVTTAGESHGSAMLAIIDGCPPGMALSPEDIQVDIERRKTGRSQFTSQRHEPDQVNILSGVFQGKTTGTPIGLLIENKDYRSRDYNSIKDVFRPGHADYTYCKKYGMRDYRGGGRSSARETIMRVAAGAIAKKYLKEKLGIGIQGYTAAIDTITAEHIDLDVVEKNPFFFPDESKIAAIEALITQIRRVGDSVGGRVNVIARGVPVGLGEPVFAKLDADIASALMGINAVKGVEIGDGFAVITQKGSEHRDQMVPAGFVSNHAGGTLGGISTGEDICASLAFKPTSSVRIAGKTIDVAGKAAEVITTGRHDPCVAIRAIPIAESMLALVLIDHYLRHKAQNL